MQKLRSESVKWHFELRLSRELRQPARELIAIRDIKSINTLIESLIRRELEKEGLIKTASKQ